jgi:hypothetical protein
VFSEGLCNERAIQQQSAADEERGMGACEGRSVGAPQRAGFVQSPLEVTNEEETTYRSRNLVMVGVSAHYCNEQAERSDPVGFTQFPNAIFATSLTLLFIVDDRPLDRLCGQSS